MERFDAISMSQEKVKVFELRKERSQMKVTYKLSALPNEEAERRVNRAFDILFEKVFQAYCPISNEKDGK